MGWHLLLDVSDLEPALLDRPDGIRRRMVAAAREGGAVVVGSRFRRFEPHGVTGVVLLAESHITVHTWPERGFAAFDVFTCGDAAMSDRIGAGLAARFGGRSAVRARVERGA